MHCDINNAKAPHHLDEMGRQNPFDSPSSACRLAIANAAVAAARLSLSTGFISNVGKDSYGDEILATLKQEGVDTAYVAVNEGTPQPSLRTLVRE